MSAVMLRDLFQLPDLEHFPGAFSHRATRTVKELRAHWERTCREAAANRKLDDLHESRENYRDLLEGHLRLLEVYLALAELHNRFFGKNAEQRDELRAAVSELRELHDELFPRGETFEDLCSLLVEKFSLPASKLSEIAAKHPPPQSWYEETIDPFTAESDVSCRRLWLRAELPG